MNLQHKKLLISCCFFSLIALAGCGLKADLYQSPESVKGEGIIPEEDTKQTEQSEDKIDNKTTEAHSSDKQGIE